MAELSAAMRQLRSTLQAYLHDLKARREKSLQSIKESRELLDSFVIDQGGFVRWLDNDAVSKAGKIHQDAMSDRNSNNIYRLESPGMPRRHAAAPGKGAILRVIS